MSVLTLVLFICGVYLCVMAVKMKNTGTIPKGLISSKINLDRAKDIPGYISYMYPKSILLGALMCIFSGIILVNDFVSLNAILIVAVHLLYCASIVVYAVISVKAQNKYLF